MSRFLNGGACGESSCLNCSTHAGPRFVQLSSPSHLPLPRRVLPSVRRAETAVAVQEVQHVPGFEMTAPEVGAAEETENGRVVRSDVAGSEAEVLQRRRAAEKAAIARSSVASARARQQEAAEPPKRAGVEARENVMASEWRSEGEAERRQRASEGEKKMAQETQQLGDAIRRMAQQAAAAKEQTLRREADEAARARAKVAEARSAAERAAAEKAKAMAPQQPVAAVASSAPARTETNGGGGGGEGQHAALLASYQSLADAFPKDKVAQLFRVKTPVTKALNQVTSDPQVTLARARDIVAALEQAAQLSPDVFKIIALHFATQVCGMVLSKMGSRPSNVFPYAAVTAFVSHRFGECWAVLSALLFAKCPYLEGRFAARLSGESERAFKTRIGCASEANYIREQNGYVTFYCAACCAQVSPNGDWRSVMPRMPELWRLLSCVLNRQPGFMAPDVITAALEVAGPELLLLYGRQMQKLLQFAHRVYLPMCRTSPVDGIVEASLVLRLATLLDKCAAARYAKTPEIDAQIFPDFLQTKRAFQMKPLPI